VLRASDREQAKRKILGVRPVVAVGETNRPCEMPDSAALAEPDQRGAPVDVDPEADDVVEADAFRVAREHGEAGVEVGLSAAEEVRPGGCDHRDPDTDGVPRSLCSAEGGIEQRECVGHLPEIAQPSGVRDERYRGGVFVVAGFGGGETALEAERPVGLAQCRGVDRGLALRVPRPR
jgi:hypothetical protein